MFTLQSARFNQLLILKILHYITATVHNVEIIDKLLDVKSVYQGKIDMCIVVANQLPPKKNDNNIIFINGNGTKPYNIFTIQRRFLQVLYTYMPDIVHIHGAWSYLSYKVIKWCLIRDFLIAYSPHGQLNSNILNSNFWRHKLPRILYYQRAMARNSNAIIVEDTTEMEQLKKLGWNRRIDIVSSESEPISAVMSYHTIYQKIIDSNVLHFMSINDYEALSSLLRSGVNEGYKPRQLSADAILNLRNINPVAYQRISLFSSFFLCLDIVERGVVNNQLALRIIDADAIVRYPLKRSKSSLPLSDNELIQGNKYIYNILNNRIKSSEEIIRELCIQLINIRHLVNDDNVSLSHLASLYERMRKSDIDEERFADVLKALGILQFARRIIQILHEFFYMEWGFMPIAPLDDKGTEKIRRVIITIKR